MHPSASDPTMPRVGGGWHCRGAEPRRASPRRRPQPQADEREARSAYGMHGATACAAVAPRPPAWCYRAYLRQYRARSRGSRGGAGSSYVRATRGAGAAGARPSADRAAVDWRGAQSGSRGPSAPGTSSAACLAPLCFLFAFLLARGRCKLSALRLLAGQVGREHVPERRTEMEQ